MEAISSTKHDSCMSRLHIIAQQNSHILFCSIMAKAPVSRTERRCAATAEKYRKRKRTVFKKVHQLSQICSADVYLVTHRSGRYCIYSSRTEIDWPPTQSTLVRESSLIDDG